MKILALAFAALVAPAQAQVKLVPPAACPLPALEVRSPRGAGGYSPSELAANLDLTWRNLNAMVDDLDHCPSISDRNAEERGEILISESRACDSLIAQGDMLLAKGVVRAKEEGAAKPPRTARPAVAALRDGPEPQARRAVALFQSEVAFHMASLILSKAGHEPSADVEVNAQNKMDKSKAGLAEALKRLYATLD